MDRVAHRRLFAGALLAAALLAACGGDNAVSSPAPYYNTDAVGHTLAAMIADGDFVAPNGGPVSAQDQTALLQVVEEACKGPGKINAMIKALSPNPYLLSVAIHLANVGCPKVISDMGIQVDT